MLILPSRLKPGYPDSVLARMAEGQRPDATIDGYPEYATEPSRLESRQRNILLAIADTIVRSRSTLRPIEAVAVIGHADKALRKPQRERATFELEISQLRASSARNTLLSEVRRLASEAHFSKVLSCAAVGVGNQHPAVPSARSEDQMRRNRRVEIFLFQMQLSKPRCVAE